MFSVKAITFETLSDEEICQQFASTGNPKLISELYKRYGHLTYGACMKYLKNSEVSKDLVSVIFEKLMLKIPTTKISAFNSWLYSVIRSECLMHLRKNKYYDNLKEDIHRLEENNDTFTPRYGDNTRVGKKLNLVASNREEMVIEAIKELKPKQRTCIKFFFFDKKSYTEIVEITGYTSKEVKSYLQNGKRNIKQFLELHKYE